MKTIPLSLFVILAFSSCVFAESFRVATYNLNWGNRRGDMVLAAIAEAKPDLICFQETTVQSEQFLKRRLANDYPHFRSVGHEERYAAERFAFASKTEIRNSRFTPPSAGLFGFYSANVKLGGKDTHVVNVHLTPFQMKRGGGIPAAMAALSDTEEKHRIEIDAIGKSLETQMPTLVVGDFNSISTFVAPKRLVALGFTDAYASTNDNADQDPTWTWPTKPLPLMLRIDYIFCSSHFSVVNSSIIRKDGSDHSLVVAELKNGEP